MWEKVIETYDAMQSKCMIVQQDREPLAPISHQIAIARIEVTIDRGGRFVQATAVNRKIIIPVTSASAGRTKQIAAHPLCDQLMYVLSMYPQRHASYLNELERWQSFDPSNEMLAAVMTYVRNGTIQDDLTAADLIKRDEAQHILNERDIVCWVLADGSPSWQDRTLIESYIRYMQAQQQGMENTVCMVTGEEETQAQSHMKGIVSIYGNAKLISSSDHAGFTYRGRFLTDKEALTISYSASQKIHNALKWLAANRGSLFAGRMFLCWEPGGTRIPDPRFSLLAESAAPDEYEKKVCQRINAIKADSGENKLAMIMAFDAATVGRIAVTFYQEIRLGELLERIADWERSCIWYDEGWGSFSPSLNMIVNFAFGREMESGSIGYEDPSAAEQMQRLLSCKVDRQPLPMDVMRSIVRKAGSLQRYGVQNRRSMIFTACAVIRKYYHDHFGKEIALELQPTFMSRSYQYGRAMAALERLERDQFNYAIRHEPIVLRMQNEYLLHPQRTLERVLDQIQAAFSPETVRQQADMVWEILQQIRLQLNQFDLQDRDKPLDEMYLIGYSHQINRLFREPKTDQGELKNVI